QGGALDRRPLELAPQQPGRPGRRRPHLQSRPRRGVAGCGRPRDRPRRVLAAPRPDRRPHPRAPPGRHHRRGLRRAARQGEQHLPEGVQIIDGPDAIRKAVREQVKYGADWIKFYSDRKYYKTNDPKRPLRSWVNFTRAELEAMVDEAHRLGRKVAAHAMAWDGIDAALTAKVDSIEHGDGLTDDLIDRVVKQSVYWCPTIYD